MRFVLQESRVWRRFAPVRLGRKMIGALVLLAVSMAGFAQDASPVGGELEGVPERVEGRIVDVTTVFAERSYIEATDRPGIAPYIAIQPKERPWRFPLSRPLQRRWDPERASVASPTALAEVFPIAQGRLEYNLLFSGHNERTFGGVFVVGAAENDRFTQGRGPTNAVRLGGIAGWETARNAIRGRIVAELRSLGWIEIAPSDEAPGTFRTKRHTLHRTVTRVEFRGDHRPATPGGTRIEWGIRATDYALPFTEGETSPYPNDRDRITDGDLTAGLEFNAGLAPIRFGLHARVRRIEAGGEDRLPIETGVIEVGFEDRFSDMGIGALDWRVAIAAVRDPVPRDANDGESGVETRADASFRLGWTSLLGRRTTFRLEGGREILPFPLSNYEDRDFVVVNAALPAQKIWRGRLALTWDRAPVIVGASVEVQDVEGLGVWIEHRWEVPTTGGTMPDERLGIHLWRPEAVDARLVRPSLFVAGSVGSAFDLRLAAHGEVSKPDPATEWAQLPYHPKMWGEATLRWRPRSEWRLELGGDWVGERFARPDDPDAVLEPYIRLRGRVTRMLTPQLGLFIGGETSIGTYEVFRWQPEEAMEGVAETSFYALNQHAVGVGFSGRF